MLQTFGVNDVETARWLSQAIGKTTIGYETRSGRFSDEPSYTTHLAARDLLTPDEMMQMPQNVQLLRVQGQPTIVAQKLRYYDEPEFRGMFQKQAG